VADAPAAAAPPSPHPADIGTGREAQCTLTGLTLVFDLVCSDLVFCEASITLAL
jgi:hypothetical protein